MEEKIAIFWVVVWAALYAMKHMPNSVVTRTAYTWIGPVQIEGQLWSTFQLRWAMYSFSWLCQIALIVSVLMYLVSIKVLTFEATWFQVLLFALPLGAGIALLATIGFLFKAFKAKYIGPNPEYHEEHEIHA